MNRVLLALAVGAAVVYSLLMRFQPYPGSAVLKTSMCALLAALAFQQRSRLLAVALLFSAAGDALLAIDGLKLFIPALASFLVTHVLYAAIFTRVGGCAPGMEMWRRVGTPLPIVFALGFSTVLWPHLGDLAIPVLVYIAAIVVMTVLSFRVTPAAVPIGALLFMTSDSLIAYEKFLGAPSWVDPLVWITYAAAQLLITYGLLTQDERKGTR